MIKNKHILRIFLLGLALTATVLVFHFHSAARPAANDSPSCKESLEDCNKQEKNGKMVWENLSQQFFSAI
jgi:hypothetical protein